jgi:hypothetical protein
MSAKPCKEISPARMMQIHEGIALEMRPLNQRLCAWKCPRDLEGDMESMVFIKIEALRTGEYWDCERCKEMDICREHQIELSMEEMEEILLGDEPEKLPGEE